MSCNLTIAGRTRKCGKTVGGIKGVYLRKIGSGLTKTDIATYEWFELDKNSGSVFTEEFNGDHGQGGGWLKTLTINIPDVEGGSAFDELLDLPKVMLEGIVIRNVDDRLPGGAGLMVGFDNPLETTGGTITTGGTFGDGRVISIVLTTTEENYSLVNTLT